MDQGTFFDQGTLAGIGTVFALIAFIGICLWAYSGRNKSRFDEAAQLPFVDDWPAALNKESNKESNEENDKESDKEMAVSSIDNVDNVKTENDINLPGADRVSGL